MVGAVVLIATAVILIPEMYSDPRSTSDEKLATAEGKSVATTEDAAKLKTYTIDLSKPNGKAIPDAPPANTTISKTPESSRIEPAAATAPPPEELRPGVTPTKVDPIRQESQSKNSGVPALPNVPSTAAPQSDGWTVQVGSFSVRATSDRVAADLKKEGFAAFVVAFHNGDQTMFRVRVGPEHDRASAEILLRKLKLQHPNATLVAPP
jgi:DedD protein